MGMAAPDDDERRAANRRACFVLNGSLKVNVGRGSLYACCVLVVCGPKMFRGLLISAVTAVAVAGSAEADKALLAKAGISASEWASAVESARLALPAKKVGDPLPPNLWQACQDLSSSSWTMSSTPSRARDDAASTSDASRCVVTRPSADRSVSVADRPTPTTFSTLPSIQPRPSSLKKHGAPMAQPWSKPIAMARGTPPPTGRPTAPHAPGGGSREQQGLWQPSTSRPRKARITESCRITER